MTTLIRSLSTLCAAAAMSAILAAPGFAADPIKIGVPVGLSGANSVVAPSVVQSAQLKVDETNANDSALGRQLALAVADDASGAAGADKACKFTNPKSNMNVHVPMETSAARNAAL